MCATKSGVVGPGQEQAGELLPVDGAAIAAIQQVY